jgi:glutamyl-Q tRNA(Asp) synthetase
LHAGSLATAVGSYLEARSRGGLWRVRIEDLDPPREVPGAADEILRVLDRFGFEWDGPVEYQSRRHDLYRAALDQLIRQGQAYRCTCTRREIQGAAGRGLDGMVYPGTCRTGCDPARKAGAWRLRVGHEPVMFSDRLQGQVGQVLDRDIGDFVLLRADGFWAYQLAVVVDDAEQGINDVVRGADLLVSTPRQIWLQRCLGLPTPGYCHLPVLVNQAGEKLSKQTLAPAISTSDVISVLENTLTRLGHRPAEHFETLQALWKWALEAWSLNKVAKGPIFV